MRADRADSSPLQTVTSGFAVELFCFRATLGPPVPRGPVACSLARSRPGRRWVLWTDSDSVAYPVSAACFILCKASFHLLSFVIGRHLLLYPRQDFQPGKPGFHKSQRNRRCRNALLFGGPTRSRVSKNLRHSSSAAGIKTQAWLQARPCHPTLPTCGSPR